MKGLILLALSYVSVVEAASTGLMTKVSPPYVKVDSNKVVESIRFVAEVTVTDGQTLEFTLAPTINTGAMLYFPAAAHANVAASANNGSVSYDCGATVSGADWKTKTLGGAATYAVAKTANKVIYNIALAAGVYTVTIMNATASVPLMAVTKTTCIIEIGFGGSGLGTAKSPSFDTALGAGATNFLFVSKGGQNTTPAPCLGGAGVNPELLTDDCYPKPAGVLMATSHIAARGDLTLLYTQAAPKASSLCTGNVQFENCFGGYDGTTFNYSFNVDAELFVVGSFPCTPAGNNPLPLLNLTCSTKKACTITGSSVHMTSVTCKRVIDVGAKTAGQKMYTTIFPNQYTGVMVAPTVSTSNVLAQINVSYTPSLELSLFTGFDTKLDALKADVAKIPTTANSSASIVPLFLLGVFGSVFALTM